MTMMASNFSSPSKPFATTKLPTTSQQDYSCSFYTNSFINKTAHADCHLHPADKSKSTGSNGSQNITLKFRTINNNKTDDQVRNSAKAKKETLATAQVLNAMTPKETLSIARKDEECAKVEALEKKPSTTDCGNQTKVKIKFTSNTNKIDETAVNMKGQTAATATTDREEFEKVERLKKKINTRSGTKSTKTSEKKTVVEKDVNGEEEKKKKRGRFSISLTKEEIDEDLKAMGVSKLDRRIKKRPKSVEKILDNLFPGLRLKSITADDYRIS